MDPGPPPDHAPPPGSGCFSFPGQLAAAAEWDPLAYQKLLEDFTVESAKYSPADRRITWVLRTRKPYPDEVGLAEAKLRKAIDDALEKIYYCGYFYDAEGRKLGFSEVFFVIGERGPDNLFTVFADLDVSNMESLAAKILVTRCPRPERPKLPEKKGPPL